MLNINFEKKCYYCFNNISTKDFIFMQNDKSFCCLKHREIYFNSDKLKKNDLFYLFKS